MRNSLLLLFLCVTIVLGELRWTQRGRVKDHTGFFSEMIQETIYEIEKRGFNMKLLDFKQDIDMQLYKWHFKGTATYANGFVVSVQKIDVTRMTQQLTNPTVNGVPTPRATVSGILNFRDIKLGYDVIFKPVEGPEQWYTGDYNHILISSQIHVIKDLTTKEITVLTTMTPASGGTHRMVYRPANNVTEVLSRHYFPHSNADGIRTWSTYLEPIIHDVIKNKIPFPEVCFSHC